MQVGAVLVVCVGNICRSPLGERLLRQELAGAGPRIESAGIAALVGHPADDVTARVAAARGVSLDGHSARQFTAALGGAHDLILAMEPGHRREIGRNAPELLGRTLLFDHWTGAEGIIDPYRRPPAVHEAVFDRIAAAAQAWAARLAR